MRVYADNAATTAMSQVAIDAMLPYFNKTYGNPSSLHSIGQEAKEALDAARATVASCLGCEPWRSSSPPAAVRPITRPLFLLPATAHGRIRSISSPPPSSITPCCTPWPSWRRKALKSPIWM